MIYAILGVFFYAIANTISRYASINFNIMKLLLIQYSLVFLYGFTTVFFFDSFKIDFSSNYILFLLIGVFGFLGAWSLYRGMKYLNGGITMLIANLYIIGSYFLNNYLVGDTEKFTNIKLVLAMLFFIVISVFLFEKKNDKIAKINPKILYPIITAFSWAIYASLCNYFIRTGKISPFQGMFYFEFFILIAVVITYVFWALLKKEYSLKISKKEFVTFLSTSFFLFLGVLMYFYGYKNIGGNTMNVLSLIQIPLVALFSYIFLKDKLNKYQIITMILALGILILFIKS